MIDENKKNELDDIPKNQRIISRTDVKSLGLTSKFIFIYFLNFGIVVSCYVLLLILWSNYFSKNEYLYNLISKNNKLETSLYRAINSYYLMIFNNYTTNEIAEKIFIDINSFENNDLLKSFYDDLKFAFNSKKEKNKVSKLYQDFEDISNFTCKSLYELNIDKIKEIEENINSKSLGNVTKNLLELCEYSRITESKDFRTVYVRHFQNIRNGILAINNHTYLGLIDHIMNEGIISRISLFFYSIIIYLLEITNKKPHREGISNLMNNLKLLIQITEFIYLFSDISATLFVIFFYIRGINNLCNQTFVLQKIFKIFEIQE